MGKPSVYPTGVTKFDTEKTFSGYTLFTSFYGATLIDMNGRLVKVWKGLHENPCKALPGGQILASAGRARGSAGAVSNVHAVQVDWHGNILWDYHHNQAVTLKDGTKTTASYHHHDFEREGTAAGYYTPESEPMLNGGNTLLLTHNRVRDLKISDQPLLDERIIEVTPDYETVWEWNAHEHFEELGMDEASKKALFANPMVDGDWIHLNSISTLGSNRFFDDGDSRFAPKNIICSSRQLNIVFIIDKQSGKIVWRIGPDFLASPMLRKLGQIIGQHHAHMIPHGLPGAGNILLFDNGSFGGYGVPTGCAPCGTDVMRRHYSRVLEFDPVTFEIQWEYMKAVRSSDDINEMSAHQFFSPFVSSAQRLPNGNTLITQGADGILSEVTPEKETVWEFVNPIANMKGPVLMRSTIYRSFRVPYHWVPQLDKPEEVSVVPPDNLFFRVPGSFELGDKDSVETEVRLK